MSLSVTGVWQAGVWAETVWGEGVWREGVTEETPSGGFFAYPLDRPRIKPKRKTDRKAAAVVEEIAERIAKTPYIETAKEIDLTLRLKLEKENIKYKALYLKWVKRQIKIEELRIKRKKDEDIIIIMLMN